MGTRSNFHREKKKTMATAAAPKINPSETAVVFIEFQNEFGHPKGKMYGAVKDCIAAKNTLANALKLRKGAASKGVRGVHVPISYSDGHGEISGEYGILQ